jgi:hypothetical protein
MRTSSIPAPLTTSAAERPVAAAHAHVQGTVLHEAEAALGVVELRRGDTEVEQNAVELESGAHAVGAGRERREGLEKNADARIGSESRARLAIRRRNRGRGTASRPSAMSLSKIAPACPPRPNVASMYTPFALTFSAATASTSSTGA